MSYSISATSLKDYQLCKGKWFFRKSYGEAEPVSSVPLVLGFCIHKIIENYENDQYATEGEAIADLSSLLQASLEDPAIVWTQWDRPDKVLSGAITLLKNYFRYRIGTVLESEVYFKRPLSRDDGEVYTVTGKIDQILQLDDGRVGIVDIKTSRYPPTEFEVLGDVQFTMYALAFYYRESYVPDFVYNFHLPSGKYIEYPRTGGDIGHLKRLLENVTYELDNVEPFLEDDARWHRGWHCNRCQFRYACYGIERD